MKVIILAGGFGTRLSEYTDVIPKPMAKIGDKPILWHIMKIFENHPRCYCVFLQRNIVKAHHKNFPAQLLVEKKLHRFS